MTMHYARTLQATHEREFLRYKKVTADGRDLDIDPKDLYDLLELEKRADRVLPNGRCLLPPRQACDRGNACLTCDKFATDQTYLDEHTEQLSRLEDLIDQRGQAFRARTGREMSDDNVWLAATPPRATRSARHHRRARAARARRRPAPGHPRRRHHRPHPRRWLSAATPTTSAPPHNANTRRPWSAPNGRSARSCATASRSTSAPSPGWPTVHQTSSTAHPGFAPRSCSCDPNHGRSRRRRGSQRASPQAGSSVSSPRGWPRETAPRRRNRRAPIRPGRRPGRTAATPPPTPPPRRTPRRRQSVLRLPLTENARVGGASAPARSMMSIELPRSGRTHARFSPPPLRFPQVVCRRRRDSARRTGPTGTALAAPAAVARPSARSRYCRPTISGPTRTPLQRHLELHQHTPSGEPPPPRVERPLSGIRR